MNPKSKDVIFFLRRNGIIELSYIVLYLLECDQGPNKLVYSRHLSDIFGRQADFLLTSLENR
jgi:hypothetical protein